MTMNEEKYKAILRELKHGKVSLPVDGGLLVPVSYHYKTQIPDCVHLFSKWRIQNPSLSPAQFPINDERTEKWLQTNVLGKDLVIMFMIQSPDGENVGHIGLSGMNFETNTVRIYSVMRGVKDKCPGIMRTVIEFLKFWCKEQLSAQFIDLLVLSDNTKAIRLYKKCGFYVSSIVPLRRIEHNGEINWIEDMFLEDPERIFLHMVCML